MYQNMVSYYMYVKLFYENTKFLRNICTSMRVELGEITQRFSPDKRSCALPGSKHSQDDIKLFIYYIYKCPCYKI